MCIYFYFTLLYYQLLFSFTFIAAAAAGREVRSRLTDAKARKRDKVGGQNEGGGGRFEDRNRRLYGIVYPSKPIKRHQDTRPVPSKLGSIKNTI